MAKRSKPIAGYFQGQVHFFDTYVPISNLFDHLSKGKSIRSFLKNAPAIDKDNLLQVLKNAELLIIAHLPDLGKEPTV